MSNVVDIGSKPSPIDKAIATLKADLTEESKIVIMVADKKQIKSIVINIDNDKELITLLEMYKINLGLPK